ncbi:MAG: type II/IV secretion system ATPase subunit [Nitrososphaerota archaeon]|nr:type II/IV secretion system ATPase subunit [Nitrososphaerota archaeon]
MPRVWQLFGKKGKSDEGGAPSPSPPPVPPSEEISGVLDTYRIPAGGSPDSSAQVFVVDNDGQGRYLVRPPELSPEESRALGLLRANLLDSIPVEATGESGEVVSDYVLRSAEGLGIGGTVDESHEKLLYYLMRELSGFWEVDPLMNDDSLEEISVCRHDRPVRVLHRDFSQYMFMETDVVYPSEDRLQAFVRRLAQLGGTTVSLAQPSLEVTLHGASDRRVTATLGDEISRPGSTYAIRKQRESPITLTQLASPERARWPPPGSREAPVTEPPYDEVHSHKTLSALMAAYFWLLLERTTNVLIAGDPNSGKTTLMNAILALADPKCKIVTAEDVLEISLPDHLHWQRLKTRSHRAGLSPASGRYEYGLSDLLKLALRLSPTILSLGEMRGEESETLAAAITLGFSTMTTIHAESAERCLQRLTTPPMRFSQGHLRDITAIATMRKVVLQDGRVVRRVVSVDEVKPDGGEGHEVVNVFRYDPSSDSFAPTTPAEVLDRSFRLNEIGEGFGWSPAAVQGSLASRAARISGRIADGELTPRALSKMVKDFAAEGSGRKGGPGWEKG